MYRFDCGVNADYELMLRFLEKEKASTVWIDKVLVNMAVGGASGNGLKSRANAIKYDRLAWKVNDLKCNFYTILLKKIRKIPQYLFAKMQKG